MTIETAFTPLQSLGGGALIGLAAVALMAFLGRIMGATGILSGLLAPEAAPLGDKGWRVAVVLGMISAPIALSLFAGHVVEVQVPVSTTALLLGGFLVGVGVTFGSGCSSGHGVCGIARLSPRSIVATLVFLVTAMVTVYVIRHLMGA